MIELGNLLNPILVDTPIVHSTPNDNTNNDHHYFWTTLYSCIGCALFISQRQKGELEHLCFPSQVKWEVWDVVKAAEGEAAATANLKNELRVGASLESFSSWQEI